MLSVRVRTTGLWGAFGICRSGTSALFSISHRSSFTIVSHLSAWNHMCVILPSAVSPQQGQALSIGPTATVGRLSKEPL